MPELRPQPGPQEAFLSTPADIAIYGGAAGGGKSFALLMEPLRFAIGNGQFAAALFRRTLADAKKPGGTWDQMSAMYGDLGARPRADVLSWTWPAGGKIVVGHLEHETTVHDWQGAQVPLLLFDELTHFSRAQFFYMLSRNRSTCGVKPYVRATCNPDADSWVAEFIAWWISPEGYAIPDRSGRIRWFIRLNDALLWADSREELLAEHGDHVLPKSVTFIASKITDNPALLKADPGYLANLHALDAVSRARLLDGNWKIRPAAGLLFQRSWCEWVDAVPAGVTTVRYWDLASTEKTPTNDPDWTVGVRMSRDPLTKLIYVENAIRLQGSPERVETTIRNTATSDGKLVRIGLPQDPGQAGKAQAHYMTRQFAGWSVSTERESGSKTVRFSPFSSQAGAGNVKLVRGLQTEFLDQLEAFPDAKHDDDVDAASGAFYLLTNSNTGLIEHYARQVAAAKEAEAKSLGPAAFMAANAR